MNTEVMTVFWTGFFVCISVLLTIIGQVVVKRFDISLNKKTRKQKETNLYYPLLLFLVDFDKRINSIFINIHEDWLSSDTIAKIKKKEGFAKDPTDNSGYFFISLMYRFGRFFGIIKMIETIKGNEVKISDTAKWWKCKKNNKKDNTIDDCIQKLTSLFQNKFFFDNVYPDKKWHKRNEPKQDNDTKDGAEIHTLIQETIGEMMIKNTNNFDLITFKDFCELYTKQEEKYFQTWFSYIEQYLSDLQLEKNNKTIEAKCEDKNDIRLLRLKAIQYWCRQLIVILIENYPDFKNEIKNEENLKPENLFSTDKKDASYISVELTKAIQNYTISPKK